MTTINSTINTTTDKGTSVLTVTPSIKNGIANIRIYYSCSR